MALAGLTFRAVASPAAELREIRPIVTRDATRLVLDLGDPTTHRIQAVPAVEGIDVPARLFVELDDTRLGPTVPSHWSPPGGPVRRMRVVELAGNVIRLILDVPGLYSYGAFPVLDPFRLVIDARGNPRPVVPTVLDAALPLGKTEVGRSPPEIPRVLPPVPVPRQEQGLTIVLDPGHGGKDPGACSGYGVREKDLVLGIALSLRKRLEHVGYKVVMTRERDVFVSLGDRTMWANRAEAALFVSIHANASRNPLASGIETYYLSNSNDRATIRLARMENHLAYMTGTRRAASDVSYIVSDMIQSYKVTESRRFAQVVQELLVAEARTHHPRVSDLGVKPGPFAVLVGAAMPAILVEVSFLSNADEARRLEQREYQERLVEGLLGGIKEFAEESRVASNL